VIRRALVVAALLSEACIIPDRDIQVDPGLDNQSAVRIVERAPRVPEMDDHCNVEDIRKAELEYCPEVRSDLPSGLLGEFCICPAGPRSDRRAIPNFIIYAEDGDRERDRPKDTLYGVALLDPGLEDSAPHNARAYENYWTAGRKGETVEVGEDPEPEPGEHKDRTAAPVGRRVLDLWRFPFGNSEEPLQYHVDLCNDNSGAPLTPGLHDLRFMVTDRPFFRPEVDPPQHPAAYDPDQFGVPDLAAGATYAVIDYVFECIDANDPEVKAHDDAQKALPLDDPDRKPLICDCQEPGPQ
jgi:hypothetical protein